MDVDRIHIKDIKYQGENLKWQPLKTILARSQKKRGLRKC